MGHSVGLGQFFQPARRFIEVFKGEFECAVVHGNEPFSMEIGKGLERFIRTHVYIAEGIGIVGANGQKGDFGRAGAADFPEAAEIGAVAGVIEAAALVFEDEPAVAAMVVMECSCAPMFGGGQSDAPIAVREAFPPLKFDDATKTEVGREVAHSPRHDGDLGRKEAAEGWLMKMIEMGVGQQYEIDWREVLDFKACAADSFYQEEPIGEIGVDEDVQIRELSQKRGMADPGQCDLAVREFRKPWADVLSVARGDEGFPDHFVKEGAGLKVLAGSQVLERPGQFAPSAGFPCRMRIGVVLAHKVTFTYSYLKFKPAIAPFSISTSPTLVIGSI